MKLNNKGFAISSIMYIILVLAVILISLILVTLSSRKLILDKLREEVLTTINEAPNITYRQTIKQLKSETISYMTTNSLEKESISIENLDSSIDKEVLERYKLNDKYITAVQSSDSYNVYLGKTSIISNTTQLPKNTLDIVDYKIYGNSIQGKNIVKYPYKRSSGQGSNGITYTINNDGSITVNGTATNDSYFQIDTITFEANKTYTIHHAPESASSSTYNFFVNGVTMIYDKNVNITLTEEKTAPFYIQIVKGTTVENITFYPMIVEGNSITTYESTRISPETPIEVESVGEKTKNLLNLYNASTYPITKNGLTLDLQKETGRLYISGTASTATTIIFSPKLLLDNSKTYTISFLGNGRVNGYLSCFAKDDNSNTIFDYSVGIGNLRTITKTGINKIEQLGLWVKADTTFEEGFYVEFQVEEGEVATEYEPYGYKIPVKASGKNLLKPTDNVVGTIVVSDGSIYKYKWATTTDFISLKAGTYTISYKSGINLRNIALFNENKGIVGNFWSERKNPYKFTLDKDYLVRIDFERVNNVDIENLETFFTEYQVQLEETKATEYEPYVEPVTKHIYLDEPLRKLGDYKDYIDFEKQRVVRNVGNVVLDSSLPYVFYKYNSDLDNTYHFYINPKNKAEPQTIISTEMLCNRFVAGNIVMTKVETDSFISSRYGHRIYGQLEKALIDNYEGATEKERLIAFLNEYHTELTYVLATPTEETIELPKINSSVGASQINIDTSVLPSNYEFTVVEKIIEI